MKTKKKRQPRILARVESHMVVPTDDMREMRNLHLSGEALWFQHHTEKVKSLWYVEELTISTYDFPGMWRVKSVLVRKNVSKTARIKFIKESFQIPPPTQLPHNPT